MSHNVVSEKHIEISVVSERRIVGDVRIVPATSLMHFLHISFEKLSLDNYLKI